MATQRQIAFILDDGRKVKVLFKPKGKKTEVTEVFEAENMNPHDLQRDGWQAILDHFGRHTEGV